jgi:antitoxin component of MazEF toxin-antitoxin module
MLRQKIFKSGHSLLVVLPVQFVSALGIKAGDEVTVNLDEQKNKITYYFPLTRQLPLEFNRKKSVKQ